MRSVRVRVVRCAPRTTHRAADSAPATPENTPAGRSALHRSLDPDLLAFARKLRQDQTEPEQFLWAILRNRRLSRGPSSVASSPLTPMCSTSTAM